MDTLIVETLDQAMPIAYGPTTRYRVVTCKGEFIDVTGVMTVGGGGRVEEDGETLRRKGEAVERQVKEERGRLEEEVARLKIKS